MRPNKLLYVDSMRGWAILMVIACHQAQAFHHLTRPIKLFASYGQTGVFLFFVASAFTLSNSATMRLEEAHPIRSFFIRRYFRIAPLYYLGIGFYAALAALLPQYTAGWLSDISPLSLVTNLAFVHGLVPDAFGGAVPGGWSISTEWMFYVLFPVLFAVCRKAVSAWGWRVLIVPVLLMSVISFATVFKMTAGIENETFYFWYCSLLTQLPVFLLGITLFMAVQSGSLPPNLKWDVPLFVITSAAALWMLEARWMLLLPLSSAASFIFLFNILRSTSVRYGIVEAIGRVSYSMYVFHAFFAVMVTRMALHALSVPAGWEDAAFFTFLGGTIVATYAVARLSEMLIERRFIALGQSLIKAQHDLQPATS
jgi:peptidoglycan/LPS O-acetylase OafA/YrhL